VTDPGLPAIAGGAPIREQALPYGQHKLEEAERRAVLAVLDSGVLTGGPAVAAFEDALAATCGVAHAVAVCNGTAALHLAMLAIGAGSGDEVITSPLTFVATPNSVLYTGAEPVFADIGDDRCLDPAAAVAGLTDRTRAVVAVDYAGLPADIDALRRALPPGVRVVVDAAHSLGADAGGRKAGSLGDVSTTSFHPVKQITTAEGGACLTNDAGMAGEMRKLRNHHMTSTASERTGSSWRYDVDGLGFNYRLNDIQAALGLSQLNRLDSLVRRRQELAEAYDARLADVPGLTLPPRPAGRTSAWHLYAIEVEEATFGWGRDDLVDALRAENIQATLHYPPAHLLATYRDRGHSPGETPRAEAVSSRLITLPLFPAMVEKDLEDVAAALERLAANPKPHAAPAGN
jgi:dTDP-4-amino-4,6-dideoxygalactose transaminase